MTEMDNEKGPNLTYYLLLKASEFPGESSHSVRGVYMWGERLRAVHQNLSYSHKADSLYLKEYGVIKDNIQKISKDYYPSERYVMEAFEILHEWLGSLSRLYYRLGLMTSGDLNPMDFIESIENHEGQAQKEVTSISEMEGNYHGR